MLSNNSPADSPRWLAVGVLALGGLLAGTGGKAIAEPAGKLPALHRPAETAAAIDRFIDQKLAENRLPASPPASDAAFLRRVTIDLIGRAPTVDETTLFLASREPDRRARLIDDLLARPEYGRNFAIAWYNQMMPLSTENTRDFNAGMFLWLVDGFNRNQPWSQTVSQLLLAEGDMQKNPRLAFYLNSANSVEHVVQAERVAGSVAQLFLGINLRCAQCHDHPFAKWKQGELWAMAAFFGRVGYTLEHKEKVLCESPKIVNKDGQPIATARADASILIPGKSRVIKARYLEGEEARLDPKQSFRVPFVQWLTAASNERFALARANRLWAHFFGRGLVHPVDDMHEDNPATHPELLQMLAEEFRASGHDQKHLIRCICQSRTYQRSSQPLAANKLDQELYSHMPMRMLRPEVLWDSLALVMDGRRIDPNDMLGSVSNPGRFRWVTSFTSQEAEADPTRFTTGVPQVLKLLNSLLSNTNAPEIRKLMADKLSWSRHGSKWDETG